MTGTGVGRSIAGQFGDALSEASVGLEALSVDLTDLDVIGPINVRDGKAEVSVSLPTPSAGCRSHVEREIVEVAERTDGVDEVKVRWEPAVPDRGPRVDFIPEVKNVVAVGSGKGGVGKSTVSVNIASALADAGANVGLLDADVYGPNAPTMLGLDDGTPKATLEDRIVPRVAHGVKVMSMGFIVGEDDPVIWRGPLVDDILKQLFMDVEWGELDYLIVDLPPGTGDTQLSLVQHLPITGAVIVTTPQPVAVADSRRGLEQFIKYDTAILGIVENMSDYICTECESAVDVFGSGGGETLAAEFDVPLLAEIPLDQSVGSVASEPRSEPSGFSIPFVGKLQIPQMRDDRAGNGNQPPVSIRKSECVARSEFRAGASRIAARTAKLNVDRH